MAQVMKQPAKASIQSLAYAGLGVGSGVVLGNTVGGLIGARIPVTGLGGTVIRAGIKFVAGFALAHFVAPRAGRAGDFVEYMAYGALGSAFTDIVGEALRRVGVPAAPAFYRPGFAPQAVQQNYFRPQAHVTPARPSNAVMTMGPSIGPSATGGPRPVQLTVPRLTRVSV